MKDFEPSQISVVLNKLETLTTMADEPKKECRSAKCPRLPIILNGRILLALLDTGASISLIREACLNGLEFDLLTMEEGLKIFQAASDELTIIGKVHFHTVIMERRLSQNFYVVKELNEECIVGMDAIHEHGIVIDGRRQFICFSDTSNENPQVRNIDLKEELAIPPKRSKIISVKIDKKLIPGTTCIVEPTQELSSKLVLQDSVVTVDESNKIWLKFDNTSEETFKLKRKECIGKIEIIPQQKIFESISSLTKSILENEKIEKVNQLFEQPKEEISIHDFKLSGEDLDLEKLLLEYKDIFVTKGQYVGTTDVTQHEIDTGENSPIRSRAYRTPVALTTFVKEEIEKMLLLGVASPSKSPWAAPVVVVAKKNGEHRFCVDYRKLNSITKKDSYPLPRIDTTLDLLHGNFYFSTLDFAGAYWQVAMHPKDKEKTAFIVQNKLYEFNVMPFGLANAPATFQRLMNLVLGDLVGKVCLVYLDDIIIFSQTLDEHLINLKLVFDRINTAKMRLRPDKCFFLKERLKFLGHCVSSKGIEPDPVGIEKVQNCPTPTSVTGIKSFIGLASYYRRFIKDFSKIAHPMLELVKKDVPFVWTERQEEAFQTLKKCLINPPILCFPDPNYEFILFTDASDFQIGAVLGQIQNKKEVVISYYSRHLNEIEKNYDAVEKDCLAIIDSIKNYRSYLLIKHFLLIIDETPIVWLNKVKEHNKRLIRWSLELAEYNFTIKHRKKRLHSNSKSMSALGISNVTVQDEPRIVQLQKEDELCQSIAYYLLNNKLRLGDEEPFWLTSADLFFINEKGILCRKLFPVGNRKDVEIFIQTVAPIGIRRSILKAMHDDPMGGHLGFQKTYLKIKHSFYWPQMSKEIKDYVSTCTLCQLRKSPPKTRRAPLMPIELAEKPFDRIAMDLIGPLNTSTKGNNYILTVIDYCTKYAEAIPIPDKSCQTVTEAVFENIFCRYGMAKELLSDNGGEFTGRYFNDICKILKVKHVTTTAYHPQTDGLVERFNRTLMEMDSHFVNDLQNDWDRHLSKILFAYNTSVHASTMETPYYLMHFHDPLLPIEALLELSPHRKYFVGKSKEQIMKRVNIAFQVARENNKKAQEKQRKYYDEKVHTNKFSIGDRVYLSNPVVERGMKKKLTNKYKGPYRVINVFPALLYEIYRNTEKNSQIVHENRLKICREVNPWDILEEEIREFERINAKVRKKTRTNIIENEFDSESENSDESDEEKEDLERSYEMEQPIPEENLEEEEAVNEEEEITEAQVPLSDLPTSVIKDFQETINNRSMLDGPGILEASHSPSEPLINVRRGQRVRKTLRHNDYDYSYTLSISMKKTVGKPGQMPEHL